MQPETAVRRNYPTAKRKMPGRLAAAERLILILMSNNLDPVIYRLPLRSDKASHGRVSRC